MKKKIAKLLVRLADWLCPEKVLRVPKVTGYKPMSVGMTLIVDTESINSYCKANNIQSFKDGKLEYIFYLKSLIKEGIYKAIENDEMIEFNVEEDKVSGRLMVYVKETTDK